MPDQYRRRSLGLLLGACLFAGCQPYGAGTITVDRQDPAVRSLKNLEDAKQPRLAKDTRKPASQRSRASSNLQ